MMNWGHNKLSHFLSSLPSPPPMMGSLFSPLAGVGDCYSGYTKPMLSIGTIPCYLRREGRAV